LQDFNSVKKNMQEQNRMHLFNAMVGIEEE
jgi:hypothetical protein